MANYKANRNRYYQQNYYTDKRGNQYWQSSQHNSNAQAHRTAIQHQSDVKLRGYYPTGYNVDKIHVQKYKRST